MPRADLYDALAIVNYELATRLARHHEVVSYSKLQQHQLPFEQHEGVSFRRISVRFDEALNRLKVLDTMKLLDRRRPYRLSSLYYAPFSRRVARELRKRQCDVAHVHSISNIVPVIRRLSPRTRVVLHIHDHAVADFDPAVIGPRLAQTSLVLGCSDFVTSAIKERYPAVAGRCLTLYNGVDRRFLEIQSDPEHSQTLLFVGRLCPEKGVHVLLEAMQRILPKYPEAKLDMVGPVDLSPKDFVDPFGRDALFEDLRQFYGHAKAFSDALVRRSQDMAPHVRLHGKVPNLEIGSYHAGAGIFVFPSLWHEPFGIPVIEAMAAGLPVVATRGGALPEIVVDGETGFLVERGDVGGLVDAISRLLANPALRVQMGAAGRARVEQLFTWDKNVAKLEEFYRLAVSGEPAWAGEARRA